MNLTSVARVRVVTAASSAEAGSKSGGRIQLLHHVRGVIGRPTATDVSAAADDVGVVVGVQHVSWSQGGRPTTIGEREEDLKSGFRSCDRAGQVSY